MLVACAGWAAGDALSDRKLKKLTAERFKLGEKLKLQKAKDKALARVTPPPAAPQAPAVEGPGAMVLLVANLKNLLTGVLVSLLAALWTNMIALSDDLSGTSKNLLTGVSVSVIAGLWTKLSSTKNLLTVVLWSLIAALWANLTGLSDNLSGNSKNMLTGVSLSLLTALWTKGSILSDYKKNLLTGVTSLIAALGSGYLLVDATLGSAPGARLMAKAGVDAVCLK